jgi:putative flippase GtrA
MDNIIEKETQAEIEELKKESKIGAFFRKIGETKFIQWWIKGWKKFKKRFPNLAQFFVFFMLSNGVTVLQMILMPILKNLFSKTNLIGTNFQVLPLGHTLDGSSYYIFDFKAGTIASGGGGGLAFFLAVEITLLIAQVINFFAQRNITFKSDGNPWKAAMWYAIAYVAITFVASAARGLYTVPIYNLLMNTWGWGATGETIADFITMIIYAAISFWIFFPIFKLIFPQSKEKKAELEKKES